MMTFNLFYTATAAACLSMYVSKAMNSYYNRNCYR